MLEFLKSVKIWQSYRQSSGPQFFLGHSVCLNCCSILTSSRFSLYSCVLSTAFYRINEWMNEWNQRPYNRRFRHRRLRFGDSVLLWAPTGQNRPTSVWRGPTKLLEDLAMMSTESRLVLTMSTFWRNTTVGRDWYNCCPVYTKVNKWITPLKYFVNKPLWKT